MRRLHRKLKQRLFTGKQRQPLKLKPEANLEPLEERVLQDIGQGLTLKQIAENLGVKRGKVDKATWDIRAKLASVQQVDELQRMIFENNMRLAKLRRQRKPKVIDRFTVEKAEDFISMVQRDMRGESKMPLKRLYSLNVKAAVELQKDAFNAIAGLQVTPENKIKIIDAIAGKAGLSEQEKAVVYGTIERIAQKQMAKFLTVNQVDIRAILGKARQKAQKAKITAENVHLISKKMQKQK